MMRSLLLLSLMSILALAVVACDDGGNESNRLGVGSACASNDDCTEANQSCLLQFKGGYCGVSDCTVDTDCPQGSACVTHDDGKNYCFLICADKVECNANRPADIESNCSSNVTPAEGMKSFKACVPPSN